MVSDPNIPARKGDSKTPAIQNTILIRKAVSTAISKYSLALFTSLCPMAWADSADAPVNSAERLDKEYVRSYAMVSGSKIDASMLGAEYAVTFCTDGALKFIMAGTDVPGLKWTEETVQTENGEADAYVVTYFDGSKLNFVFTENGFELDFFGSMLMYFE